LTGRRDIDILGHWHFGKSTHWHFGTPALIDIGASLSDRHRQLVTSALRLVIDIGAL